MYLLLVIVYLTYIQTNLTNLYSSDVFIISNCIPHLYSNLTNLYSSDVFIISNCIPHLYQWYGTDASECGMFGVINIITWL